MEFQVKVLLISFAITVAISFVIIPILRKLKVGQIERDDGPSSHLKKQGTPTMGGIIIIASMIIVCIGLFIYYRTKEPDVAKNILPMLFLSIGFGVIGFIDDFKKLVLKNTKGLKPAAKMFRIVSNICSIYIISYNDFKNRNRYIYTIYESIYINSNLDIYTICYISNAISYKCN